ncbi:hypothetical protein AHAS_Ahas04G0065400 [Arachis hypogaea]
MKENNGCYSVSLGYHITFQFNHPPIDFLPEQCKTKKLWSGIWNSKSQSKTKIFMWKALHKGLPVKVKLHSRIPSISPICPRCNEQEETVVHCLWMCPDSKEAWRLAGLPSPTREVETWKWWPEFQNNIEGGSNMEMVAVNLTWQN